METEIAPQLSDHFSVHGVSGPIAKLFISGKARHRYLRKPKALQRALWRQFLCRVLLMGLATASARAQTTVSATTSSGGNWTATSPATWTCTPILSPCLPSNNASDVYNVMINGGAVLLNSSSTLTSVTVGTVDIPYSGLGTLQIQDGESLTTTGDLTNGMPLFVSMQVDGAGKGGSRVKVAGTLTNGGVLQVGNTGTTSGSSVTAGSLSSTGQIWLFGGSARGAPALLDVSGAAPSALAGIYLLQGDTGGAVAEFGSGSITSIVGALGLNGANAFMETGATNSSSALTGLSTIARYGELSLTDGASVTTNGALANSGTLLVGDGGSRNGSTLTVGGNLTDSGLMDVGVNVNGTVTVNGTLDVTNGQLGIYGGNMAALPTTVTVTGAAPSTLEGIIGLTGSTSAAVLNYKGGSGITQIGGGSGNPSGYLDISGTNASVESAGASGNSALTGLSTIASNGGLDLYDGASLTTNGALSNSGSLYVAYNGSTLNVGGNLTDSGLMDVSGGNANVTVNGSLTVNSSRNLWVGYYGSEDTLTVSGSLTNAGSVYAGYNGSATVNVGGNLTNAGSVEVGEYSAFATVNVAGNMSNTGSVMIYAAGTLNLRGAGSSYTQAKGRTTINGTVTATNSYTQSGGTTDVDGKLISPTVTISGGTLEGAGTIKGNAAGGGATITLTNTTFRPGDPMSLYGAFDLNSSDIFNENIVSGSNYGALHVLGTPGTADLGSSALDIVLPDGYSFLTNGETFTILDAVNGISGTFATINGLDYGLGSCRQCYFTYTLGPDTITLTAHAPEPASPLLFGTGLLALAWAMGSLRRFARG